MPLDFTFGGNQLYGLVDVPAGGEASSLIIVVHGHGKTNVQEGQWSDLRSTFTKMGITTVLWDKAGCGKSEGVYDHNQSVQSSALEVLAAIEELRRKKVPGAEKIGLWGISRAGWICPEVIKHDPSIAFWISVSGTDEKESFGYLLRSNFKIEGRTEPEIETLHSEWLDSSRIFMSGGSWSEYSAASQTLRNDPFYVEFFGGYQKEEGYLESQREFMSTPRNLDPDTGLILYVPDFKDVLSSISCPVLAIFGEKDRNVDWKGALKLYRKTIDESKLTVKTFPDGDHNLQKRENGGLRESRANRGKWNPCEGYYECMIDWLKEIAGTTDAKSSSQGR